MPDRRSVTLGLASVGLTGASAPMSGVLAPPDGPPMASAGLIAGRSTGEITLSTTGGFALGPSGRHAFTLDAPFRVASVSKMITAALVVPTFLARGVDLDGDASGLLGFRLRHPAFPDMAITPRMLLSHTSGLRNGPSYPVPLGRSLADAFRVGGKYYDQGGWFGPPNRAPGDWFAYADVNFALLAQMLEVLMGDRFDRIATRSLFAPLGLDVGFNWSGVSAVTRAKAAAGLRQIDGRWTSQVDAQPPPYPAVALTRAPDAGASSEANYKPGDNGFVFSPQGGLRLSLNDMHALAQLFAEGGRRLIPAEALVVMETPSWTLDPKPNGDTDAGVFQSYGLGVQTPTGRPGPNGDAFFGAKTRDWRGHLGDAYGWMTGLFWNVRTRETLVWAINGMPETGRPAARGSSLTIPEEVLIGMGLRTLA